MSSLRRLVVLGCVLSLSSAWAAQPFDSSATARPSDDEEQRVWDLGRSLEQDLQRKNRIRPPDALDPYLQSVLDKLYPEFKGTMTVKVLMQPEVNAFTTAPGTIFLTEGLLARLENEAQLATVLGHEGAHFVYRHAASTANRERMGELATMLAKNVINSTNPFGKLSGNDIGQSAIDAAKGALMDRARDMADDNFLATAKDQLEQLKKQLRNSVAGSFSGVRPDGLSTTSVFGFNGGMEREADEIGMRRMVAAGYDPAEAIKLFKILGREMQQRSRNELFFFSSLAMLNDREASFKELSETSKGTFKGDARFAQYLNPVKLSSIQREITAGRYESLLTYFSDDLGQERLKLFPEKVRFYLGEAYRIRAADGDLNKAVEQYRHVLAAQPAHFGALRSLGLVLAWQGNTTEAVQLLKQSLSVCGSDTDRGFTEQIIQSLQATPDTKPPELQ